MAKKLLVIDSDPATRKRLEPILPPEKFEVIWLNDGLSALGLFDKIDPDLILVDYHLEGISIHHFCEKIKQKNFAKERPTLMLVSAADQDDTRSLLALSVGDVVRKPIGPEELLEKLKGLSGETASSTPAASAQPLSQGQAEGTTIEELLGWSLPSDQSGTPAETAAHPAASRPSSAVGGALSPEAAEALVIPMAKEIIEKVVRDVVPRLAEILIKEEIERLKTDRPS